MSPALACWVSTCCRPGVGEERGHVAAFAASVAMDANDGVADGDPAADDAPEGDAAEVIAVVEVGDEHLKIGLGRDRRRRDVFHDRFEERRHVFAVLVDLAHGEAVLGAGVNDREIELLVVRLQLDEEIEDHVEHLVRARVFAIDFVDDDDRLDLVLERFFEDETCLRLRAVVRVDDEKNAVDHFHDALDFAAEIGVTGRVDDVDAVAVPVEGGVLGADGDALFALEIHRVHHAFLDLLVGAEGAGLAEQLIDERGLAVVDVGDDCDVADFVHEIGASKLRRAGAPACRSDWAIREAARRPTTRSANMDATCAASTWGVTRHGRESAGEKQKRQAIAGLPFR